MLSRRQLLGGLLASGAAGCAADPDSTLKLFSNTVTSKRLSPADYPLTAAQIHDLPYAALGVRIAQNQRSVVILATIDGQNLQWVSADRVIFVTNGGWLVGTRGLERDLVDTRWLSSLGDPIRGFAQTGVVPERRVYREVDLRHADEQAIAVESRFEIGKDETISIQGREHSVLRIDEIAIMRKWRWETRNSFWVEMQTGRVWRSRQRYCPEMPPIELEVLKPAAIYA